MKSAVRNFLSAFDAPGEFIISLLLPGGLSYLFKIRFLVFFPLLPSYALSVVVQDIFQAILYVAETFAAFLRSSRWLCLSSQIRLLWPPYRILTLTRKHPQDRLSKTLIRKLPLHKLLVKCKRYGHRSHLIYCASLSRFPFVSLVGVFSLVPFRFVLLCWFCLMLRFSFARFSLSHFALC